MDISSKMRVIKYFVIACLMLTGLVTFIHLTIATLKIHSSQFVEIDSDNLPLIDNASVYINNYFAGNSRLPDTSEVTAWMQSKDKDYEGRGYSYQKAPFHKIPIKALGAPSKEEFILSFWNGEFFVDYFSWYGNGKLAHIPDSEYFIFGSQLADCCILLGMLIVIIRIIVILLK